MHLFRAVAIAVALLLAGGGDHASAQFPGVGKNLKAGKRGVLPPNKAPKNKAKQAKQAKQAAVLERFLQMSPDERARALQQLSPERRRQILQRLNAVELLSDEERRTLRGRFDAFLDIPPDRQPAVRQELQQLRGLPPGERRNRLASSELRDRFSEDELQFLDEVAGRE